jgi:ribosomal protein L37AE/L43A
VQETFQKTERYVKCPACGKSEHAVSHLPPETKTAWYCHDCGAKFKVYVISHNFVDCEVVAGEKMEKRLVTLRSLEPVTLLVEGMVLLPDDGEEESLRYFYDEHTCPTNFMGQIVEIVDANGDKDPHGIFAFVKSEPWNKR